MVKENCPNIDKILNERKKTIEKELTDLNDLLTIMQNIIIDEEKNNVKINKKKDEEKEKDSLSKSKDNNKNDKRNYIIIYSDKII